jgi:hypothetical protein
LPSLTTRSRRVLPNAPSGLQSVDDGNALARGDWLRGRPPRLVGGRARVPRNRALTVYNLPLLRPGLLRDSLRVTPHRSQIMLGNHLARAIAQDDQSVRFRRQSVCGLGRGWRCSVDFTVAGRASAVPSPVIGAGLPGLIFASGGCSLRGAGSGALKRLSEFAPDFAWRAVAHLTRHGSDRLSCAPPGAALIGRMVSTCVVAARDGTAWASPL